MKGIQWEVPLEISLLFFLYHYNTGLRPSGHSQESEVLCGGGGCFATIHTHDHTKLSLSRKQHQFIQKHMKGTIILHLNQFLCNRFTPGVA
jgi:hypothetical protein